MNSKQRFALVIFGLAIVFLASLPSARVQADGGGWPSATPSPTPTAVIASVTDTPGASVSSTDLLPTPKPGGAVIQIDVGGLPSVTPAGAYPAPADGGAIACWPVALVALIAGIFGLSAIRNGLRRGQ